MDHIRAINKIRDVNLLSQALDFAIYDRKNGDHFFNPLEIEHAEQNRSALLDEIIYELNDLQRYCPRTAFAFFPPKNALCERRLIYIPIKDLTIRYAFCLIFADEIELSIHPECFANRRATGEKASIRLTEDFATGGWLKFCKWQAEQCKHNRVLLKTDISSFYDSISHDYLINSLSKHFGIAADCEFMMLFKKMMRVPVIHYSPSTGEIEGPYIAYQGLPLGDGAEGYLANLYLKDVDDAMILAGAKYGRYVDDIRIFGQSRPDVVQKLRILQEQLLRKGLNLNSSKTEIAEDADSQAQLASRTYIDEYIDMESEEAGRVIAAKIDAPIEDFNRAFAENEVFERDKDAKDFCRYLSVHNQAGLPLVPLDQRTLWHVDKLREVITTWRGPTKHAAWLLVQTATYRTVPLNVKTRARSVVISLLLDPSVSSYARYRILHHLIKIRRNRNGGSHRLIWKFSQEERGQIIGDMKNWLSGPAFELNLIALYLLHSADVEIKNLQEIVAECCKPNCIPARDAISALKAVFIPPIVTANQEADEEPDALPDPY